MLKKINLLFIAFIFISPSLTDAKASKDFEFEYENRAGRLARGTVEKIVVKEKKVMVYREAVPTTGGSQKERTTTSYDVSEEQMEALEKIIKESGFMDWPQSAEIPHQSHADEYIRITLNNKTVRHTKWEKVNQESFRILWTKFNRWYTDIRSARF